MTPTTQQLLNLARRLGVTVELTDRMDATQAGAWKSTLNTIYVAKHLEETETEFTLAHELAHVILNQNQKQDDNGEDAADNLAKALITGFNRTQ